MDLISSYLGPFLFTNTFPPKQRLFSTLPFLSSTPFSFLLMVSCFRLDKKRETKKKKKDRCPRKILQTKEKNKEKEKEKREDRKTNKRTLDLEKQKKKNKIKNKTNKTNTKGRIPL